MRKHKTNIGKQLKMIELALFDVDRLQNSCHDQKDYSCFELLKNCKPRNVKGL